MNHRRTNSGSRSPKSRQRAQSGGFRSKNKYGGGGRHGVRSGGLLKKIVGNFDMQGGQGLETIPEKNSSKQAARQNNNYFVSKPNLNKTHGERFYTPKHDTSLPNMNNSPNSIPGFDRPESSSSYLKFQKLLSKVNRVSKGISKTKRNIGSKQLMFEKRSELVNQLNIDVDRNINNQIKQSIKQNIEKMRDNKRVATIKRFATTRNGKFSFFRKRKGN